jgi:hypothetical protein
MRCELTRAGGIRPFLFHKEASVVVYLDALERYVMPQVPGGYVLQQDRIASHFWTPVTVFLCEKFADI